MRKLVIHQPNFFPYLGYFEQIAGSDVYIAYDNVQFTENEFQNRNFIKGPNGKTNLTLSVARKGRFGQLINEVELADEDWAKRVNNRLRGFYARAPFYDKVMSDLEPIFASNSRKMIDINMASIRMILNKLNILPEIHVSSNFAISYHDRVDRIFKLMEAVDASTLIVGSGAATYLSERAFEERGYQLDIRHHRPKVYKQLHGDFIPHLSVLDYLMNVGWKYWGI